MKFICNCCDKPCILDAGDYPELTTDSLRCVVQINHYCKWEKYDDGEVASLPKLTAEVFARPDCPEWAQWAAVCADCTVRTFLNKPTHQYKMYWYDPTSYWEKSLKGDKFDASDWQNSLVERPAKALPDWCKVGEWVCCKNVFTKRSEYFKIAEIKGDIVIDQNGEQYFFTTLSQARLRPYNAEEMKALVGKVISHQPNAYLCVGFHKGNETVDYGPYRHTEQDLLKTGATIDGKPCGVLEHLEEGEWIK